MSTQNVINCLSLLKDRDDMYDEYTAAAFHELDIVMQGISLFLKINMIDISWEKLLYSEKNKTLLFTFETKFTENIILVRDTDGLIYEIPVDSLTQSSKMKKILSIVIPSDIASAESPTVIMNMLLKIEGNHGNSRLIYEPYSTDENGVVKYMIVGRDNDKLDIEENIDYRDEEDVPSPSLTKITYH